MGRHAGAGRRRGHRSGDQYFQAWSRRERGYKMAVILAMVGGAAILLFYAVSAADYMAHIN